MTPFWCACCTDAHEQPQPLDHAQLALIAVAQQRHTVDVLHDQERAAIVGEARVEDARDMRMVEQRQRLPFHGEARQHFLAVHAWPDQLDRDLSHDRLPLLGEEHRTHAAGAEMTQHAVGTDPVRVAQRWQQQAAIAQFDEARARRGRELRMLGQQQLDPTVTIAFVDQDALGDEFVGSLGRIRCGSAHAGGLRSTPSAGGKMPARVAMPDNRDSARATRPRIADSLCPFSSAISAYDMPATRDSSTASR
jgi:hypothetical protein